MSKPLRDGFKQAVIERRDMYGAPGVTPFPSVTSDTNAASDHAAVWTEGKNAVKWTRLAVGKKPNGKYQLKRLAGSLAPPLCSLRSRRLIQIRCTVQIVLNFNL